MVMCRGVSIRPNEAAEKPVRIMLPCSRSGKEPTEAQLVLGSFAHAVHHLVDALDLSAFAERYRYDDNGAPAHVLPARIPTT